MYNHVVLGGTFDHFHRGHEDLLHVAFKKSHQVSIGITKASMNMQKIASAQIEPFGLRKQSVAGFITALYPNKDFSILPIKDMYGSTLVDPTLEAIIVTPHTLPGAEQINQKRKELGFPELKIELCPLRKDENDNVLSSSNIRLGVVNRDGKVYRNFFKNDIPLLNTSKTFFQRPLGKAVGARKLRSKIGPILVMGDIATQYCIHEHISFNAAYIDRMSRKKAIEIQITPPYSLMNLKLPNPAGYISQECVTHLLDRPLKLSKTVISVVGEEDLLTVAAVILLPLGTRIVYGYPYHPSAMRCIHVTQRIKDRFFAYLQKQS